MKSNVSKNARTGRKSLEKLKYLGREVEPIVVYSHAGKSFKSAMYSDSRDFVVGKSGDLMTWDQVKSIIDATSSGNSVSSN